MNCEIRNIINCGLSGYVVTSHKKLCSSFNLPVSYAVNKISGVLFVIFLLNNFIGFGQTTIWEEDFSSYTNNTGVNGPGILNVGDYPLPTSKWRIDASGTGLLNTNDFLKVNSSCFQGRDVHGKGIWLTETIDISSFANVSVSADFWKYNGTMEATDSINFYYRLDGGSWTAIKLLNDDISTTPQNYSVSNINGNLLEIKVEIILETGGVEIYAFDDVLVQGTATTPPPCTTPISPTNGKINFLTDGTLSWNPDAGATGYYLYFGTDASATNIENGTDLGNVTTYTPASDLDYLTDYYWKIVPYNGIGSATGCSVWLYTTEDCSVGSSAEDEYIDGVQIETIDNNNSGYSSNGYGNFTNLSTNITQGQTGVQLTITYGVGYTDDDIGVWVDWNQDGDFNDTGENIICQAGLTFLQETYSFDVPVTAFTGLTTIRIRMKYYDSDCGTPCGITTYGEVEDYTVNIIGIGPTLSVTPTNLNFGDNCPNTISSPQSFTITGTSLITDDILVAALNGYSYSTTVGGTYTSSLTLTQPGGNFSQIIYVQFTPTAVANYDGNVVVGGGGATNINVAVSGSGAGFDIPLNAVPNTVDCPNSTNGTIDFTVPFPIQFNDPNYIDIDTTLLSDRTAFTLEGWIKVDLASVGSRISLFGQNDAIEFGFNSATELTCWTASGGSVTATNIYPTDNGWHHVAVVGNGTNMILYIDGAQVSTGGIATTNYGADTNFSSKIGAGVWDASGGVFPGQMIKVGFWSTALNATEIDNLASTYYNYTGSETGLLAGYNFFEGTGTTLSSTITGTDGTFSGSPTWINNYTYLWTKTGDVGFSATTQDLSGVGPGTYNVVVTNSTVACPGSGSWTINHLDTEDPTITCPADVVVNPDAGLCTYSGGIGTPVTSDNCNVASVTNDAPATFPMEQTTVKWTVTDDAGKTATCNQTVTVEPTAIIDITVVDLGNSCQSGETDSTTTITWDITLLQGSNSWTYDYTIKEGATTLQSGTNENATGNIQISYTMNNETATDKTYTITLTNVKDNCGVAETNTGNNSDVVTLFGVPNTGNIIPD